MYLSTSQYFHKDRSKKDSLCSCCKNCQNNKSKEYYKKYKKERQEYKHHYRSTIKGYLQELFSDIKRRCNNPNNSLYKWYGARGIKCRFKSSKEFVNYVINELQVNPHGLEIDRVNSKGHYEKNNIRFITKKENLKNRNFS